MLAHGAMHTPVVELATEGQLSGVGDADSNSFAVLAPWATRTSTTATCPASHAQCRAVRPSPPCINEDAHASTKEDA